MLTNLFTENENFTKSELRIIDYINTHTGDFIFQSIGEVAQELNVSDATVSRLAKHAGFADFKDLKKAVIENHQNATAATKMASTINTSTGNISSWLENQKFLIDKTLENIDEEVFQEACQAVTKAKVIYIHGKNSSYSVARLLLYRLSRLGLDVRLLPAGSEIAEVIAHMTEKDLVLFSAYYSLSVEAQLLLKYSKILHYKTIGFTSRTFLPPEDQADFDIFAYRGDRNEYHPQTVPIAIVDGLVVTVAGMLGKKPAKTLETIREVKDVYKNLRK